MIERYIILQNQGISLVRVEGLEPPRLAAPEPKSGASTNFATPAEPALFAGMPWSITKPVAECEREIRVPLKKFVRGLTPSYWRRMSQQKPLRLMPIRFQGSFRNPQTQ